MTDCRLVPHPTDPTLCWCETCKRTLPIRLIHAHRNCAVQTQPEPRPEAEQAALVEVCKTCPEYGDPLYPMAPVCQLDAPASDTEPCRKKAMVAAYLKRLQLRGGECGPWRES